MAENTSTFTGAAADGTALTAVYLTQPAANVAIGLVFAGSDLPRIVHWGRPLAKPDTLLAAYDALKPQRVSGALDDTVWPSILPTQAESWIGEQRVVLRRAGVELFPKFTVTNIETGGVLEATLDAVSGESYTDVAGHARATGPVRVPGVIVTVRDEEQGVEVEWHLELLPGGLVRQKATVTNLFGADAGAPLEIGKIELGFPLPESAGEILTTTGHHLRERSPQRQPLTVGRFEKPQLAGRPDFDASLLLTAGVPGFGFELLDHVAQHAREILDRNLAFVAVEDFNETRHVRALEVVRQADVHVEDGDGVLDAACLVEHPHRVPDRLDADAVDGDAAGVCEALYVRHDGGGMFVAHVLS